MADPIKPSSARLLALHDAVIGGDAAALGQIWVEIHRSLCGRLRRRFRKVPADLIEDAATDAICAYGANPIAFDRGRGVPLEIFLFGISSRLLRDRLRTEERRTVRETAYVTHRAAYDSGAADRAPRRVLAREVRTALREVCDESELAAIEAYLDHNDRALEHLGLSERADADERHARKRLWNAVVKRVRRLLNRPEREAKESKDASKMRRRRHNSPFGG